MDASATYILAGGGTGGHLFPGIAVADELRARQPAARLLFVGSQRGIERQTVGTAAYEHVALPAESTAILRRHPLRFLWNNWRAYRAARKLLLRERPAAVVGLGGFASVPVVLAASRLGVATVLLEQNVVPGRATRWLSSRASLVCLSFAETIERLPRRVKSCLTGNPVRREIAALAECDERVQIPPSPSGRGAGGEGRAEGEGLRAEGWTSGSRPSALGPRPPCLLILGGSQGAAAVNDAVLHGVEQLRTQLAGWQIVHQTGAAQCDDVRRRYAALGMDAVVEPFFAEMTSLYRSAAVAVSRAGATTLAELACAGLPAVLIPYPYAAEDHQMVNARLFEQGGAARIVEQPADSHITAERLTAELMELTRAPDSLMRMNAAMRRLARPDAAARVVDEILRVAISASGRRQPAGSPAV